MKRRSIELHVSDHAVLRYLNGAELGAMAVRAEGVRIFLRDIDIGEGRFHVTASTVAPRPGKTATDVSDG